MHLKNIRLLIVRKQLKKEYPGWERLNGKKKTNHSVKYTAPLPEGFMSNKHMVTLKVGDYLILIYILLIPVYSLLPRIPVLNFNAIRLVGICIALVAVYSLLHSFSSISRRNLLLLLLLAILSAVNLRSIMTFRAVLVLQETFPLTCFLVTMIFLNSEHSNLSIETALRVIIYSGIVAFLLSVLIYTNILSVNIFKEEINYKIGTRTAWIVDNMINVLAILASGTLLHLSRKMRDILLATLGIAFSLLSLFLGGFRIYIALSLFMLIGCFFLAKELTIGSFIKILFISATIYATLMAIPLDIGNIICERFKTAFRYESYVARADELKSELRLIKQKPLIGHGFGVGSSVSIRRFSRRWGISFVPAYGHNLFSSFALRIGIPFTAILLYLWVRIGRECWYAANKVKARERPAYLAGMLLVTSVLLASPFLNLFIMSVSAPIYAVFLTPYTFDWEKDR